MGGEQNVSLPFFLWECTPGASTRRDVGSSDPTLTGAYKFTKMLLGRLEFRQDWSNEAFFKRGSSKADSNQSTLAAQVIYTF